MKVTDHSATTSFREKGSKFMGFLFPAGDEEIFEAKLDELKRRYPDATHHCYGWRLYPAELREFAQDDGEPAGTAGQPILNQLKSFEVVNAGLVVVRYYGGTNLGRSGLISAYGRAAADCLQQAALRTIRLVWKVEVTYPYAEENAMEAMTHRFALRELDASYGAAVQRTVACPAAAKEALEQQLQQLEHRGIGARFIEKTYL